MMTKATAVLAMLLAVGTTSEGNTQQRRDVLVSFNGGIGVIPVLNVAGTATGDSFPEVKRNIVRGVIPAPGPWTVADLRATVDTYGRIKVRGRGLLLAGGDGIGQNANLSVFATLICEAAATFVERSTNAGGVPLEPNGDFRIDDTLDPATSDCASPVLLIRGSGSRAWLAAGIPASEADD